MESMKKLVCSSSPRLPCQIALDVQAWSKNMQKVKENCLVDGFVSSLTKGVHVNLTQNKLTKLADIWKHVKGLNKRKFCHQYR